MLEGSKSQSPDSTIQNDTRRGALRASRLLHSEGRHEALGDKFEVAGGAGADVAFGVVGAGVRVAEEVVV